MGPSLGGLAGVFSRESQVNAQFGDEICVHALTGVERYRKVDMV
jgi:hypothetical protein